MKLTLIVSITCLQCTQDIFFGHNTWDDYQCGGPRIFKRYTFPVLSYVGDSGALAGDDDEENYSDHDLKESKKSPGEQQENSENPSNGIDTELLQESNVSTSDEILIQLI